MSFPHVLGHEVVGRRADTGQRVVLNPWLSCTPRGIDPPCAACQAGRYPWCRNFRPRWGSPPAAMPAMVVPFGLGHQDRAEPIIAWG